MYCDEIDAGDPIAPRSHTRNVWAFYFSFLEFGMINLSKEEAWLTVTIARTVDVDLVDAGYVKALIRPLKGQGPLRAL